MTYSLCKLRRHGAWLGLIVLACGEGALEPPSPPRVPAVIEMLSGDDQEGAAGAQLGEPFRIRVTDAEGGGVSLVEVTWRVTSGAGEFFRPSALGIARRVVDGVTRTGFDGTTRVYFRPSVLGPSTITAEAAGVEGGVTFTVTVTRLVVRWIPEGCEESEEESAGFYGPDGTSAVSVPVGTRVEWTISSSWWPDFCGPARIASTSVPAGGEAFASGPLDEEGTFWFVPGVPGTWGYVDEVSGATGTLTAR